MTRKTKTLERLFEAAIEKAVAADVACASQFLEACPRCGKDDSLSVIRLTGMDGRRYYGDWPLERDGFAWGADSHGNGSSENEVVFCYGCRLERWLHDFYLPQ
jgi:hypothetical protein